MLFKLPQFSLNDQVYNCSLKDAWNSHATSYHTRPESKQGIKHEFELNDRDQHATSKKPNTIASRHWVGWPYVKGEHRS